LEIHPAFGAANSLIGRLRQHGYVVDLRDNAGAQVTASSGDLAYAYGRRPGRSSPSSCAPDPAKGMGQTL
jgi:hypothetical protein